MSTELRPGDKLDRYVVDCLLGVGSMAHVYGVKHQTLNKRHAVKLLHVANEDVQERLIREGMVQASIDHVNVLRVNDVFLHENTPALLMERIDGPDLELFLRHHRPTVDEALAIFGGILAAVQAAHKKGITHRDLKPANVLLHVTDEGIVPKVADFGLAKALDPRGTNKTTAGLPMGTPWYMAPEQIRDASSADMRADIFSLGCILYELITGTICFAEDDILETYRRVAGGLYAAPREFVSDLPYHIASTIEHALQVDPTRRLPDAESFGRALYKGTDWPTIMSRNTEGAAVVRRLLDERKALRVSASVNGPGIGDRGSDQLLGEMRASLEDKKGPGTGRSKGPIIAIIVALLFLGCTGLLASLVVSYLVFG